MSSTMIAAYAVFCVIVFAIVNTIIRRKRNGYEIEQITEHESVEEIAGQGENLTLSGEDDEFSVQVLQSAAATTIEEVMEEVEVEKPVPTPKRTKETREAA